MVTLEKVEAMIQNDIAENGDDGYSDAGGYGYNIMEEECQRRWPPSQEYGCIAAAC